jgi:hypothetical protein
VEVSRKQICQGARVLRVALGHWVADPHTQRLHQKENTTMRTLFAYFFKPDGLDKQPMGMTEGPTAGPGPDNFGAPLPPQERRPFSDDALPPPFDITEMEPPDDLIDELISNDGFPSRQFQKLEGQDDFREPFVWETNDGDFLELRNMATPHLFYTLRMIFNHSVPPAFRIGQFRRRANVDRWPLDYREQAGHEIRAELRKRSDLEPWMKGEVQDMVANAAYLEGRPPSWQQVLRTYAEQDGLTADEIRRRLGDLGLDADRYVPQPTKSFVAETNARIIAHREKRARERRANLKEIREMNREKRMRRAVPTDLTGFPDKRCMEHRSYAGIRKPRVDCNACKQVYRARQQKRKTYRKVYAEG